MLKYLLAFFLLTLVGLNVRAQSKTDTLVFYVKNDGNIVETKDEADYLMLILPATPGDKKTLRPVLGFYINGKRKMIATAIIKSNNYSFEGTQMVYFPNGKRKSVTMFENGIPVGEQVTYHPNGTLYTRKDFQKKQTLLVECRDSTGVLLTENGNGEWMDLNDTYRNVLATGKVKNGLMEGEWYENFSKITYKNGVPSYNMIFLGRSNNNRNLFIGEKDYMPNDSSTIYQNRLDTLNSIINAKIDESYIRNNTGKQMYVGFFVEENGSLNNFRVFQSSSPTLNEKLVSIIKSTSPWEVSKKRTPLTLPVFFPADSLALDTTANKVTTKDDIQPEFPGGLNAFAKFLGENVRYPGLEREFNVMGKVSTTFIVEEDGSIGNIHILKTPSIGLAEQSLRVIRLSPKWNPGVRNGKPTRMQFTVPINFTLDDELRTINSLYKEIREGDATYIDLPSGKTYVKADVMPEFIGGIKQFGKFLERNLRYPGEDRQNNVMGKVYVTFVVEKDGSLSNVEAVKGPSATLKMRL
jgi:hypothetical protein